MRFRKREDSFNVHSFSLVRFIMRIDTIRWRGGKKKKKIEKKDERMGNAKINLFIQGSVIVEEIIPIKLYGLFDLKSVLYS